MRKTFKIGGDTAVARIGLGAMRLSAQRGFDLVVPDEREAIRLIREAVRNGTQFIDTADIYGEGANEKLIFDALGRDDDRVVVATKGGLLLTSDFRVEVCARPEQIRTRCEESLRRLGRDCIDLYFLHRIDPDICLADTIGALASLREEGKIRHIGLSNVSVPQLKEALEIAPIAAVQNRFNAIERESEDVLMFCTEFEIAFVATGPFGGVPGSRVAPMAEADGPLAEIALKHHLNPATASLLWLLNRAPNVIAIPGTTSVSHALENISVLECLAEN